MTKKKDSFCSFSWKNEKFFVNYFAVYVIIRTFEVQSTNLKTINLI